MAVYVCGNSPKRRHIEIRSHGFMLINVGHGLGLSNSRFANGKVKSLPLTVVLNYFIFQLKSRRSASFRQ